MSKDDFEGANPGDWQKRQTKLHREELAARQTFEEWCRATARVLNTADGAKFLEGLKAECGYDSPVFLQDDEYNTHAAARRDGAKGLIRLIVKASNIPTQPSKS